MLLRELNRLMGKTVLLEPVLLTCGESFNLEVETRSWFIGVTSLMLVTLLSQERYFIRQLLISVVKLGPSYCQYQQFFIYNFRGTYIPPLCSWLFNGLSTLRTHLSGSAFRTGPFFMGDESLDWKFCSLKKIQCNSTSKTRKCCSRLSVHLIMLDFLLWISLARYSWIHHGSCSCGEGRSWFTYENFR